MHTTCSMKYPAGKEYRFWTTLISAYVVNQKPQKALELFRKMQMLNVETDQVTLTVALSACADLGSLEMGKWIHTYVRQKLELQADLSLDNAFINMYAKCGEIQTARKLFDSIGEKDVTIRTSMIVAHALHGQASEALELFGEMEEIKQKNSKNKEEAGLLKDAYDFIIEMPSRDNAVMWMTLLGACSVNGEIELGEKVMLQLLEPEPGYVGDSVAMSNIYAAKGMWDKKVRVRDQIKQLRKAPGCSSIEVTSKISEFVSGDDDHPLKDDIYETLLLDSRHENIRLLSPNIKPA
ncbi:Transcription elongation factor (TFIIS) family protein, putative isoform 1 [Hibiscus syriacus]|uniref:Transcription elongation factor (TFIIS) family protein, putative isoform 1 n=1 Tax=Hibiscus syriacus TaxID=106335 RepID=A0A6A3CTR6_HIBSY|nr:Transcription elongation factor (TFIIS) family protein, putative isoform 1 [Hibiscus syriacus]